LDRNIKYEDMMSLVTRAGAFAAKAHAGQVRKYTKDPYHVHVARVAALLAEHELPEPVVAAGFLHDTVEDCGVTFEQLRDEFGDEVACLVMEVTDISRPQDGNRAKRKEIDRQHVASASPNGQSIKLADLIDNTSTIVRYDPNFAKVYLPEKARILKVLTAGHSGLQTLAKQTLDEAQSRLARHQGMAAKFG
jgi:(p)ppGpp synthase/HD superfamily hydrolase